MLAKNYEAFIFVIRQKLSIEYQISDWLDFECSEKNAERLIIQLNSSMYRWHSVCCLALRTQTRGYNMNVMRSGWLISMLLIAAGGCGADENTQVSDANALVRQKYPDCARYIDDHNPQVKNGIIGFNCGQEVDGPYYYLRADNGEVISICGGACWVSDDEQRQACLAKCPPPGW